MTPLTVTYEGMLVDCELPGERFLWAIWEPFRLVWMQGEEQGEVHVPKYFCTDFASVPKLFWSVCSPWDSHLRKSSVVHDVNYMTGEYPRAFCDALLFAGARAMHAPAWKCWLIWLAVRVGGRKAYQTGFARQIANAEHFQLRTAAVPLGSITICDPTLGFMVYDPLRNTEPADYVTARSP